MSKKQEQIAKTRKKRRKNEQKRSKIQTEYKAATRVCGECQECCITMGVPSIDKPANKKCEHQCLEGCGVYDKRPDECRIFSCMWRQGFFPEDCRPDKMRVMLYVDDGTRIQEGLIVAHELTNPVLTEDQEQGFYDSIGQKIPLYVIKSGGGREIYCPPDKREALEAIIDKAVKKENDVKPDDPRLLYEEVRDEEKEFDDDLPF